MGKCIFAMTFATITGMFSMAEAAVAGTSLPPIDPQKVKEVRVDTIVTRDTIIRTEVITRTDVISRTEVTVRRDSVVSKGNPLSVPPVPLIATESTPSTPSQPHTPTTPQPHTPIPPQLYTSTTSQLPNSTTPEEEDPNERVLFRGDTIPMRLKTRNLGRFDRGLFNYLYIPKGVWQLGATASYGEFSSQDLEILDLMSDIDISGQMFSVKPYASYFFNNNTSLGVKLIYSKGKGRIDSFSVDVDDDVNFNLHDIRYNSETIAAAIALKQYYGITSRGRFALFNEVELLMSSGNSDFVRPYNSELKATHTNVKKLALNFSPGLSVFIIDPVSFNISFGVFGLQMTSERQTVDGEPMGKRITSGANFRFNIFNIDFGLAVSF